MEDFSSNFIINEINEDLKNGKHKEGIHTRFPPEPNGYLHIGHAKSICLNFGMAKMFNGICNLRFDDTNPTKEDVEYVESILNDVKWIVSDILEEDKIFFASDYFPKLYDYAVELIKLGKAYVDDQSPDEIRATRGSLNEPGVESPYRNRSVEENLDLFHRMKNGEFADAEKVLRAKIDMSSSNMNMRDPIIYRIAHMEHHRTKNEWCIYPMYDFAHPLSDAIEGITHSICTLEFENHRPLYDWVLDSLGFNVETRPRQIEFARLNLTNTVTSKRKLRSLVEEGYVSGWDDPRMPTISGLRRRGYTPRAIRNFCYVVGVAKANSIVDYSMLEHFVRDDLNLTANRVMAVLHPLKVIITNYPEEKKEYMLADASPFSDKKRYIPFTREIYIEQDDFMEDAPKKFFRLKPEGEVRLKHGYIIKCEEVIKDEAGNVVELHCTYDPDSKTGGTTANRKIKGTIHWVSANESLNAEIRIYSTLIETDENGNVPDDFLSAVNKDSLKIIKNAKIEPSVLYSGSGNSYQFLRIGYFVSDKESNPEHLIYNQIVGLKDSWAKAKK